MPDNSMLERVKTRLMIDIHPSRLCAVETGVHEHLNGMLLRYNEDLEGVPLAYSDERVVSHTGIVHSYFPLTRLTVSATFTLFRPRPGMFLEGVVNKVADDFIGLVVLGFMNAVVKAGDVQASIRPRPADGIWASSKEPSHTISVGDSVVFTVREVRQEGQYVSLTGALKDKGTGNVAAVGGMEGRKTKKRKVVIEEEVAAAVEEEEEEGEEEEVLERAAAAAAAAAAGKKRKKTKDVEEPEEEEEERPKKKKKTSGDNGDDSGEKKKRKKGKK